jgi:hypothetical protein
MYRCCFGWQEDDNSEGFSVVSLLGVAPLEPAPFAEHPTLLVVGKDYSVKGSLGGVFFQVIPTARTVAAKNGWYSMRAGYRNSPRANWPGCGTAFPTSAHSPL